jgi:tetratricopeptide (TPR) repeat protein/4-amino-4-deoxy-L-arabinose transferase-like glycosyltransferase
VAVLAGLVLLRLGYLWQYSLRVPYFQFPVGDSLLYLRWAAAITGGDVLGASAPYRVFYQAPLYPYLLAGFRLISGNTLLPVYLFQIALGGLSLILVYHIGRRVRSHRAGLTAMVLLGLYAPMAFKETKLVPVTLAIALLLGATALLVDRRSTGRMLAAGLLCGAAAIAWGGALPVLPLLLAGLLVEPEAAAGVARARLRLKAAGVLTMGWGLVLLPVLLHNLLIGRDPVLVSANGGYTFYQGNNRFADGLISHPPEVFEQRSEGRYLTDITEQQAFDQGYPTRSLGREVRPSEASAFWFRRGLDFIRGQPAKFLGLTFQKLRLLLGNYEFASTYHLGVETERVPLLRFFLVPFALILGLGLAGITLLWSSRGHESQGVVSIWPLLAMIGANAMVLVIFYSASRYRLPLVPPLAVFAGIAVDHLCTRVRAGRPDWPRTGLVAAAILISAVVCTLPMRGRYRSVTALGFRNLGETYLERAQDPVRAEQAFDRALYGLPDRPERACRIGASRLAGAAQSADVGPRAGPGGFAGLVQRELLVLRGRARLGQKKFDAALADLRLVRQRAVDPEQALAELSLAFYSAVRHSDRGHARELLDSARVYSVLWRQVDSLNAEAHALVGDIAAARGDSAEALSAYRRVLELDSLRLEAWRGVADLALARCDTAVALEALAGLIRLDGLDLNAQLTMGTLLVATGRNQEARDRLQAAIPKLNPAGPGLPARLPAGRHERLRLGLRYVLALSLRNLGDTAGARQQAREILELQPDFRPARELLSGSEP